MGLYNLHKFFEYVNNEDIKNGLCPICQVSDIRPIPGDGAEESFDYFCKNCIKTISISGSVLMEGLLDELKGNNRAQIELKEEVRNFPGNKYILYSDTVVFFIEGECKNRSIFKFEDWLNGNVPGITNNYQGIDGEELLKINNEQKRILDDRSYKKYESLLEEFKRGEVHSTDSEKFLEFEIETVNQLFSISIGSSQTGQINLGNWSLDSNDIGRIQKYYRSAVKGIINCNIVMSPNQKLKIGTQEKEMNSLINAIAFTKYSKFLRELKLKKDSNIKSNEYYKSGELKELNEKINRILEELGKLGFGQEIIYNEIDSFRESSEKLSKKDFKTFVLGKLVELGGAKIINSDLAKLIYKSLFGEELKLLL